MLHLHFACTQAVLIEQSCWLACATIPAELTDGVILDSAHNAHCANRNMGTQEN